MQPSSHFSALSSWVLLIARGIDSYGLNSAELFAQAGLDHSRLHDPVARFSSAAVSRLWELAARASADPCFGLTVAGFWHPTTLHALGYAWLASNNLDEAFSRALRYLRIVNTAASGVVHLEKTETSYRVMVDGTGMKPPPPLVSLDAALAMLLQLCRAAYGPTFRPLRVTIQRPAPESAERFSELFAAPVEFSQAVNSMWLDLETVSKPLITANPELVRINDRIVTDYLAQLDRSDVTMQVRSRLIESLPSGQTGEVEIAAALNMSKRSLQRRLKQQGVSFSQILESSRRELALNYVRDSRQSFNEIAYLLGFAEPGNFSRAFKRWYGKSPSHYRQAMLA